MNDELSAWQRSREATRQIMAEMGRDEKGYPLAENCVALRLNERSR